MGELIDIVPILKQRRLEEVMRNWQEALDNMEVPSPIVFGWEPLHIVDGQTVQYTHSEYDAKIGLQLGYGVWLSYGGMLHYYDEITTLPELALGIETGTL
jgi:hypothetical protein